MPIIDNTIVLRNLHGITFIKTPGLVILNFYAAACSILHNIEVEVLRSWLRKYLGLNTEWNSLITLLSGLDLRDVY